MKRLLCLVLVSVLLVGTFVTSASAQTEIRFAWWGSVGRHAIYNEICDMFEAANPDVKILREYSEWGDYWDRLTTQAAGGNQPDVMQFNSFTIAEYSSRGVLKDLEPLVEQGLIDMADWDSVTKDIGRRDGVLYAIPFSYTISSMFVNISFLDRLGLEAPDPNVTMTLDEFSDFVLKVQGALDEQEIEAWALQDPGTFENFFETFIRQRGKTFVAEDGTRLGFDRQDLLDYFNWIHDLRKAGAIPPAEVMAEEGDQPWENSMQVRRRIVIQFSNSNQAKVNQRYMGDDIIEIYRIPVDPDGALSNGEPLDYMTNGISATTEHPEAAARFVDFFTNNVDAQRVLDAEHGAPTSPTVLEALTPEFGRAVQSQIRHMNQVKASVPPYFGRPAGVNPIIDGLLLCNDEIAFGAKTVERAVDDFLREAERSIRRLR